MSYIHIDRLIYDIAAGNTVIMSAGPLETYNGTSGVANNGGDSLTEDLNIYYSVRMAPEQDCLRI